MHRDEFETIRALGEVPPERSLGALIAAALEIGTPQSEAALEGLDRMIMREPLIPISSPLAFTKLRVHRPVAVRALAERRGALGLAVALCFNGDGYIRESAVRNLIGFPVDKVLPYLMFRSGDWVPAIVNLSANFVFDKLARASDQTLIAAFPVYLRLCRRPGGSSRGVVLRYRSLLESRPGLIAELRFRATPDELRGLAREELVGPDEDYATVLQRFIGGHDPALIGFAIAKLEELSSERQFGFIEELAASHSARGRCLSLKLADEFKNATLIQAGVYDRNWRVRNDARFYLNRLGQQDFVGLYRARLPDIGAIGGFGEVATEGELTELVPLIDDVRSAVRREAIRSLGRREFSPAASSIQARLSDPFVSVIRESAAALNRMHISFPLEKASQLFDEAANAGRLKLILPAVMKLVPRWDRLPLILRYGTSDGCASGVATQVSTWLSGLSRQVIGPSNDQLRAVTAELDTTDQKLTASLSLQLRREVAFWESRTPKS